jgi:cellulose synthase/poly-beta-1,6-N-acetylglucosamine synthase-like glycosyltransferase
MADVLAAAEAVPVAGRPEVAAPVATVVIPARDEERAIADCLRSVLASDERSLQVIVVDGASTDRTREIVLAMAEDDPRIELLVNPAGIIPASLNLALAAARAPWFVRVDAHATVPPDYVRRAVDHLRSGSWGAVGGRKDGVGRTPAGRAIAAAMASPFGVGGSTYHHGTSRREVEHVPFGAYPTELARALGGWDERLRVNQDFEFDHRVRQSGHRILFDPELRIDWECRQAVGDLYRQYRRYGRGKAVVAALHPRSVKPRHLVAPAFVAALAAGTAVLPRRAAPLAALAGAYGAALGVATASAGRGLAGGDRRWLPAAFAAMHVGWGIGFWEGAAAELRRRLVNR